MNIHNYSWVAQLVEHLTGTKRRMQSDSNIRYCRAIRLGQILIRGLGDRIPPQESILIYKQKVANQNGKSKTNKRLHERKLSFR